MTLRDYSPPTITELGSLTDLTQATFSGNVFDYVPGNIPIGNLPLPVPAPIIS
jgi:hypothetical protein